MSTTRRSSFTPEMERVAALVEDEFRRRYPRLVTERAEGGEKIVTCLDYCQFVIKKDGTIEFTKEGKEADSTFHYFTINSSFRYSTIEMLMSMVERYCLNDDAHHAASATNADVFPFSPKTARRIAYRVLVRRFGACPERKATKTMRDHLMAAVDRPTMRLVCSIFAHPHISHYNLVVKNRRMVEILQQDCRFLTPLLPLFLEKRQPPKNVTAIVRYMKNWLIRKGIQPRTWRMLARLDRRSGIRVCNSLRSLPTNRRAYSKNTIVVLNMLAETGEKVPFSLFSALLADTGLFDDCRKEEKARLAVVGFMRAAAREAWRQKRTGTVKEFANRTVITVLRWLLYDTDSWRNLDRNQVGAPWSFWQRCSDEWHAEQQRIAQQFAQQPAPEDIPPWESLLGETSVNGLSFVPLVSSEALAEEAVEMYHCVNSYAGRCHSGQSRIFSVRQDGKRIATVEICRGKNGVWRALQVRGFDNGIVEKRVQMAAQRVAKLYTATTRDGDIQQAA